MTPTWGMSQRLPRRIGVAMAKELMFTGRVVDGAEAARIGLANRCVPDAQLDAVVGEITSAIIANSWFTSRGDKMLVNAGQHLGLAEGLAFEGANSPGAGPDMAERLARR